MTSFFYHTKVIARRDFLAVVKAPTFLLFLLAPLLMLGISIAGGSSADSVAKTSADAARIAVIGKASDKADIVAVDARLREMGGYGSMAKLEFVPSKGNDLAASEALFGIKGQDYRAIMFGDLAKPVIRHEATSTRSATMLAEIAEQVVRSRKSGIAIGQELSTATYQPIKAGRGGVATQRGTAYGAVFGIFFLTLILAGQAVGMLAEEKGNKVIEVIAAAAPLEAVFLGKLVGMFGVAILFVGFWASLLGGALVFTDAGAQLLPLLQPAVGIAPFIILFALYFTMSYMLLGAVFLAVGGLASTVRDIQMLSLPITFFQVGMFVFASSASNKPGTGFALGAELFPFSSPMAMAARAGNMPELWPHALALGWQVMWVAITIFIAARLFRVGVLKSGGGLKALFSR